MNNLPPIFEKYKPFIEKEIRSLIDFNELSKISNGDITIYEMMKYHMGWIDENGNSSNNGGGKYLRATLALMACESICGDFNPALPVAAAIELIHNYSLVHDDIQDDDEFRRHKPTVWKIWGKPQAINVGSAMKAIASNSVFSLSRMGIPLIRLIEILKVINEGCLQMIEGQYLDISFESQKKIKSRRLSGNGSKKNCCTY